MQEQDPFELMNADESILPSSEPPQHPPKSKTPLIALGLLLLAVGLVAGFYAYQKQTAVVPTQEIVYPTPTPIVEVIVDPTSTWKEYTFPEVGLTFSAPADLSVTKENTDPNTFVLYIQNTATEPAKFYQLYVVAHKGSFSDAEVAAHQSELEESSITEVMVGGYKAIRGQYKGERNRYVTSFAKDGTWFTAATAEPTKENEALSNQILSTFKFSN